VPDPLALDVDDLWRPEAAEKDFAAAEDYLSLRFRPLGAQETVSKLRELAGKGRYEVRRCNDILRASGLPPLPPTDPGIRKNMVKLARGRKLAPVLLVSFDARAEIADGYHRVSCAYWFSPDNPVRCLVADA
jgi:hypothetical protein